MDICQDYSSDEDEEKAISKKALVSNMCELGDENSKDKTVSSLEWANKLQETLLVGYTEPTTFYNKSGLVEIWSLAKKEAPTYTISCQTQITTSIFHMFKPNIILCGTSTGQILQYDTRSKPIPFSSTQLDLGTVQKGSDKGSEKAADAYKSHAFPISCLAMLGSENNANIISISGDGALCMWSMANMLKPLYRIELLNKAPEYRSKEEQEVLILSKCLSENHPKKMIIGSEDGNAYEVSTAESDEGDSVLKIFKGHKGPVNSIEYHPFVSDSNNDFSDIFLTSSSDWTSKLWSISGDDLPIVSFDCNDDCIYASKWHPTNPSVFVTGDGTGKMHFWDLNKDWGSATYEIALNNSPVISKLSWSDDGKRLAAGRNDGKVSVYGAGKDLLNVKAEDYTKFKNVLNEMRLSRKVE